MSIVSDFKDFVTKGNVVSVAVAFVFGAAFTALVSALVSDLITPLIGIPGAVNFNSITYTVNGSTFYIGPFVNAVLTFIIIAFVVFFFIVRPITKLEERRQAKLQTTPTTKICPQCLQTIPVKAKRCMYCTSKVR